MTVFVLNQYNWAEFGAGSAVSRHKTERAALAVVGLGRRSRPMVEQPRAQARVTQLPVTLSAKVVPGSSNRL